MKACAGRRRRSARPPAAASRTGPTAGSERILHVTPGYHLIALDAKTGDPFPSFGKDGMVDLLRGARSARVPRTGRSA